MGPWLRKLPEGPEGFSYLPADSALYAQRPGFGHLANVLTLPHRGRMKILVPRQEAS